MNRNAAIGIGIALVIAYLWSRFRPLTPSVEVIEYYDTDDYIPGTTDYPATVKNFARAIANAEGFGIPGAIPTVCHNPGDLKLGEPSVNGITQFQNDDLGWSKLYRQIGMIISGQSAHYHLDMSIKEMGDKWENDPGDNWAINVANYLAVSPETKLWEVIV